MNKCICCDRTLLRHIRDSSLYWYCSGCRQEMPTASACSHPYSPSAPVEQIAMDRRLRSLNVATVI